MQKKSEKKWVLHQKYSILDSQFSIILYFCTHEELIDTSDYPQIL